jgi:hypothetical protein
MVFAVGLMPFVMADAWLKEHATGTVRLVVSIGYLLALRLGIDYFIRDKPHGL